NVIGTFSTESFHSDGDVNNNISDEEFVPLYDYYRSKNPDFGYQSHDVFDLENMNSADCKAEFRVEKADLPLLADALHIPAVFQCKQRSIWDEGRKHDAGMLADSGLLNDMGNFAFSPAGQPMCVYGDPAYPL
ncbi:unnamed protein product, partial [Porites evermanni]